MVLFATIVCLTNNYVIRFKRAYNLHRVGATELNCNGCLPSSANLYTVRADFAVRRDHRAVGHSGDSVANGRVRTELSIRMRYSSGHVVSPPLPQLQN